MFASVKWKVIVPVSAILVASFALLTYHSADQARRELAIESARSARALHLALKESLGTAMVTGRPKDVDVMVGSLSRLSEVEQLRILDRGGRVLVPRTQQGLPSGWVGSDLAQAARDDKMIGRVERGQVYQTLSPIQNGPRCIRCHGRREPLRGFLEVGLSVAETRARIAYSRNMLVLSGMAAVVATGAAILLIITLVVERPIRRLITSMRRAEQDLSVRADVPKHGGEVAELGLAFNRMLGEIETKNRELIEAQRRLAESERLASLGLLAAGVAHEINNPLTTISVAAERLLEAGTNGPVLRLAGAIAVQTRRISEITQQLVRLDRAGGFEPRPVGLNALLRQALAGVDLPADGRIEVRCRLPEDMPIVWLDPAQMRQAMGLILTNAVQAMEEGGRLEVSAGRQGDWIELCFQDTGPGIPAENLDKIFTPFFTTKEVGEGMGLGLAICLEIIRRHQGEIEVACPESGGTVVMVRLPLVGDADKMQGSA